MLDISLLPMLQTSRDICGKKPLSFLRYSFIRYSRHEGLCFSWLVAGWTGDVCISDQSDWGYYKQPIQLLLAVILVDAS